MFFRQINEDIKLSLSIPQYSEELFTLIDKNRSFLKQWLAWLDNVKDKSDTKKFLESQLLKFQQGRGLHSTIFYQNRIAGVVGYNQIDRDNDIGYVGYWLAEDYNGRGIIAEDKLLMVMKLDKVVPFGRSLDEYMKMFSLSSEDLQKRILGVGDGPASFNAEGTKQAYDITSIDPVYQFNGDEIKQRFDAVADNIIDQIIATPNNWVWSYHKNPQELKARRIEALELFLQDYKQGKQDGRYLTQALPELDFSDRTFDLALCSHLLFLYSAQLDRDFHLAAIQEMLRVSKEVRIFPLLTLMQETSPYVDDAIDKFSSLEYSTEIAQVNYELQPGANKMLVIKQK